MKLERWADQYDFDKSDPATRLFVAASNWMDRCEYAEKLLLTVVSAENGWTDIEKHLKNCGYEL